MPLRRGRARGNGLTLVIAAEGKDYVVAATDSRGTIEDGAGNRVELNMVQKLFRINDHAIILLYGETGQAQYMIDELEIANRFDPGSGVRHIAIEFGKLCRREAKEWRDVPTHPRYNASFGFFVVGLDEENGAFTKPRIYELNCQRGFKMELGRDGFLINGKPMIAYYNFAKRYERDKPLLETCRLVAQSFHDTIEVDGDVGGRIRMAILDSTGEREPDRHIIEEYIEDKWTRK
jgi:20S proteasome alpha/beta subunit